jgi:hypothetical protein
MDAEILSVAKDDIVRGTRGVCKKLHIAACLQARPFVLASKTIKLCRIQQEWMQERM